jgi:hypothetical protein
MKYGSICSGIEAATVAWQTLGWKPAWFSEIASFPSAVLNHHYPDVANLGDMTKLVGMLDRSEIDAPDVVCGGTPCQAFSVSGNRQSLGDDRIGIMTFVVNVEGGSELLIDFEMPINEIVERTSDGFVGQPLGVTWRHTDPEWYLPDAKKFIRQKLDDMGYDFIESRMLAIKRTGTWGG